MSESVRSMPGLGLGFIFAQLKEQNKTNVKEKKQIQCKESK